MAPALELLLCDIDGCLTGGEGSPIDWEGLQAVAAANRRHRAGEPLPAVTLCTGRPSAYVELMAQLIDCHLPCIYEHGCGLYDPVGYRYIRHPAISAESDALMRRLRTAVEAGPVRSGLAFVQPGKEHSISIYPMPGQAIEAVEAALQPILGSHRTDIHLLRSVACLELLPMGIDKGAGARALSDLTGVPLARCAGIGDSPSDQPFLDLVAFSATPANGDAAVRVDYRTAGRFVAGVLEVIERMG